MFQKLGLQVYTVRDKMTDKEKVLETFRKVKSLGYDQIQTAGLYGLTYAEYKQATEEAGLEIVGTHDDFNLMITDFEQAYQNHMMLGTKLMGIGGYKSEPCEEELKKFAVQANEVGKQMFDRCGGKFTYHNHSFEFRKMDSGKTMMEGLMEYLDPRYTSFVLDTYWVTNGGGDVRHYIDLLAGRIDILHLKDVGKSFDDEDWTKTRYMEIGSGNLWWEGILEAAEKAGVKYYVVEQDVCPGDPFDSIQKSSEYLHKHFMK